MQIFVNDTVNSSIANDIEIISDNIINDYSLIPYRGNSLRLPTPK